MAHDSLKQGSLCRALALTEWVRILVGYYFFILFWLIIFVITTKSGIFHSFRLLNSFSFGRQNFLYKVRSLLQIPLQRTRDQSIETHVRNIVATLLIVLNVSIILNYLKISLTCHIMMNRYWKCSTQIFISMIKQPNM